MRFHLGVFLVCERAFLVEDRIRDSQFPNIVEKRAEPHIPQLLLFEAQLVAGGNSILTHPVEMAAGVAVACLDGRGKGG